MSNQRDIESNMIQSIVAGTSKLTYFGRSGVTRAILRAVSYVLDELQFAIDQAKRASFLSTAVDTDLDDRAGSRGVIRLGSTFSTAVVLFSGTDSTVIPSGTELKSEDGLIFVTANEVTIGALNAALDGNALSIATADKTLVTCQTSGIVGNVTRRAINALVTPIAGVDSLTNPMPATGGSDVEKDVSYRFRAFNQVAILNKDTQDYYQAKAAEANSEVLRTYTERGSGLRAIKLTVARSNGGTFTATERIAIQNKVTKGSPALVTVDVQNVNFTTIAINFTVHKEPGFTLTQVFTNLADNLADFLDWSRWAFGQDVNQNDLLSLCRATDGVEQIQISTFTPIIDKVVAKNSLPKMGQLTLIDGDSAEQINPTISTTYVKAE